MYKSIATTAAIGAYMSNTIKVKTPCGNSVEYAIHAMPNPAITLTTTDPAMPLFPFVAWVTIPRLT
jgi:hypothetical protein